MARLFERTPQTEDLTISTKADGLVGIVPSEAVHQMEHLWVRLGLHQPVEPSSVAMTSYLRGEGVTLMSLAVAAAASQRGRTLLVDANVARPVLLAEAVHPGLLGFIDGTASIEKAVVETDRSGLDILPVGADTATVERLELDPKLAGQLIGALSMHYDTVIVDSPSLQEPAPAIAIASACSASLLVVRHRVTDVEQVQAAADSLADTEFLGVVLNGTRLRTPRWLRRRVGGLS